jgi:hypothetical protein
MRVAPPTLVEQALRWLFTDTFAVGNEDYSSAERPRLIFGL